MSPSATTRHRVWIALLFAIVMNVTNLVEPLAVDDVCHHYYASQVAKDPLQPYEFETVWHQKPVPAWNVMVAPVHSYYWAPLLAWADGGPVAWKAWFLPLQWLFCWALLTLLVRCCRSKAVPVLATIVLGPAVLPGINLMLEIPVLAFAFASVVALLRACERRSAGLAVLAGVLLGVAFQTKYSAMGFAAPWTLLALVHRRWRELLVGAVVAAATALTIEVLLSLSHGGGSYFLRQLELTHRRDWYHLLRGMVLQVGWLGVPAAVLALVGLGAPRWVWGGFVLSWLGAHAAVGVGGARLGVLAYFVVAAGTWGTLAWLLAALARSVHARLRAGVGGAGTALRVFLLAWIPAELVASFVLSPFPAARRSLLVVLAFTVAAGWLVARRRRVGGVVRTVAVATAALGLVYQGIDVLEGRAMVDATTAAMDHARRTDPRATVWFTGGWGFEFYAPRAGMRPLLRRASDDTRDDVRVAAGDFVVIGRVDGEQDVEDPWWREDCPVWTARVDATPRVFGVADGVPLSTLFGYYSGRRPIEAQVGARFTTSVHRVREAFDARELTPEHDEHEHPAQRLR